MASGLIAVYREVFPKILIETGENKSIPLKSRTKALNW